MKMGSSAHEALKKIATQKQLVADMEKMNEKVYTTYLDRSIPFTQNSLYPEKYILRYGKDGGSDTIGSVRPQ